MKEEYKLLGCDVRSMAIETYPAESRRETKETPERE
jgi:hypothetical protein